MSVNILTDFQGNQLPLANENLLINGDFQVNQRGQTSYSTNSTNAIYTVDRWRLQAGTGNGSVTLTVNEDGSVTISNQTTVNAYLVQVFEKAFALNDYTASFEISNKTGIVSFAINDAMDAAQEVNNGFNAFTGNGSPSRITFYLAGGSSMTLRWVKLEQGSIATPFVPRLYAEELLFCQWYYRIFKGSNKYLGLVRTFSAGTSGIYEIPLATSMRTTPTISASGVTAQGNGITFNSVSLSENMVGGSCILTGATGMMVYFLYTTEDSNSYLALDAEIK